ncbi:hypothetical protein [Dyadobacter luticola]|uniref:DUF1772 domain-containing protein n=1 Tax=Dyadobacter luticola TaxID=1979387 RepID=A0A5R9KX71_9BACT|nr:hypothetical protein [Dyadobacter luticola]TLV00709.1 hypothetical protein FEN17_14595 [Dyadobacter luticola]
MKTIDALPLIRIVGMTLYFFIAAQGAFYHFGFGKALFQISPESFIELRKAVDPIVRPRFKGVYFSALGVLFLWVVLLDKSAGFWSYGPVLFAFLLLVTDMVLIVKFSEPINELINSDLLNTQTGYVNARAEWLKFILIRGCISMTGFFLLLLQMIFQPR